VGASLGCPARTERRLRFACDKRSVLDLLRKYVNMSRYSPQERKGDGMRILGLDLGTTSVGWALVDWNEASLAGAIKAMGVRIFPEGVVREQTTSYPPNRIRRTKRLARRTLRRRRVRRKLLGQLLHDMGLLPVFSMAKDSDWAKATEMDKDGANDPYNLRRQGLEKRLEPWQLGRAIYHLGKRRGFLGRDFDQKTEDDAETKGIKAEIEGLRNHLAERTLGAYLADLPAGKRKRKRHTSRDMFQDELTRLWETQSKHYPDVLTAERKQAVEYIMFYQRPVFWRLNTLGHCRFCPDELPAPKAAWSTQQWVMLEQINKLRIVGGNQRRPDERERAIIVNIAQTQRTVTFGAIRKALKDLWVAEGQDIRQKFNLEDSEDDIKGNALEAALAEIFGDAWATLPTHDRIRAEIHERVFQADYLPIGKRRIEIRRGKEQAELRAKAAITMQQDWGITAEQAQLLSRLRLPAGWSRFSTKAIETMLPEMDKGIGVGDLIMSPAWRDWRFNHFPDMANPTGEIRDMLPAHPKLMPETRNPTVTRTLNEVRKVINNLIRAHGKPDLIRVELARELRQPKKRREETDKKNREREKQRKVAVKELEANDIPANGRNIEKWLLWKECNERCPYTGQKIGFDALFRNGQFDIEHIWPRSRSLDNGFANKTLCEVEFNRNIKGNRAPYEIFGHDEGKFHDLKMRLRSCFDDPHHPKIRRFLAASFAEAGSLAFEERQLRDTAYAAVLARDFLKSLYPDDGSVPPVMTCNGSITAQLRDAWKLNTLLSDDNRKNRADHRHHAVDALAVAFTTPAFVKRLSDWNADWRKGLRPELPKPWATIQSDADQALKRIVVSHRVRKKVSGALHAETYYGDTGENETKSGNTYRLLVTRKNVEDLPIEALSQGKLEGRVKAIVRDDRVRKILKEWVDTHGGNPKKAFITYPRLGDGGPEIRKVRVISKQQLSLLAPVSTGYADLGKNHHMAIYREKDGAISFEVVPLFEAARRLSRKEPIIRRGSPKGGVLVMSLVPGDIIEFPPSDNSQRPDYRVVTGVWANGPVVLEDHLDADGTVWGRPNPTSILKQGGRKVAVDPVGRIKPAHD
jgi:CRISPR-associated endonuclease Csn1